MPTATLIPEPSPPIVFVEGRFDGEVHTEEQLAERNALEAALRELDVAETVGLRVDLINGYLFSEIVSGTVVVSGISYDSGALITLSEMPGDEDPLRFFSKEAAIQALQQAGIALTSEDTELNINAKGLPVLIDSDGKTLARIVTNTKPEIESWMAQVVLDAAEDAVLVEGGVAYDEQNAVVAVSRDGGWYGEMQVFRSETGNQEVYAGENGWIDLPDALTLVQDGRAVSVEVDNPSFEMREGELFMLVQGNEYRLDKTFGWSEYEFTTPRGGVDIYRDLDIEALDEGGIVDVRGATQEELNTLPRINEISVSSLGSWFRGIGHPMTSSVLFEQGMDNSQIYENGAMTLFAMLYYETGTPTDEQLLSIKQAYDAKEPLQIQMSENRSWNLSAGGEVVIAETGVLNTGSIFSILEDGSFRIVLSQSDKDMWTAASQYNAALQRVATENGLDGYVNEFRGTRLYAVLYREMFPIVDGRFTLPIIYIARNENGEVRHMLFE